MAQEEFEFNFPYSGGTNVWLTVRNIAGENSVALSITENKGQFIPSYAVGSETILVRFGEREAEYYYYVSPSDYSSELIFIVDAQLFIENLKTAGTTLIQCNFFNEGTKTITFDTSNLQWEH
ncbi:MAG: hypothetical protein LBV18_05060 [Alistipes sp.]|jgi:hypothetical protein|nr:hypothetical protein [Alistipes sp.]